jgi:tRNA(fMet)-specific endonuclease VapC
LSWFELHYGLMKSARVQQNRATIAAFLALDIAVWPFDIEDVGDVRFTLERAGTPIGPFDILIAAQARRRGPLLVTANGREFGRVPGLRFDHWANPD